MEDVAGDAQMNAQREGAITRIENGSQTVVCDTGHTHLLSWIDRVKDGRVGDRVILEFQTTEYGGMWCGRKVGQGE